MEWPRSRRGGDHPARPPGHYPVQKQVPFPAPSLSPTPIYSAGRHYLGFVRWYLVGRERREKAGKREGERIWLVVVYGTAAAALCLRRAPANRAVGFSERSAMCCKHRNATAERAERRAASGVSDVKIALGARVPSSSSQPICKLHRQQRLGRRKERKRERERERGGRSNLHFHQDP